MSEAKRQSKGPVRGYFFDKSVVVTGASSGIGHDVALAFGEQGAQVALLARRRVQLEELAHKINKAGGKALALDCDVTDRARVFWAIEQVKEAFGTVDILINSAGLLISDPVEQMRPEDLEKMMAVNVFGALNAMQAVLPVMRKAKSGNIVNISSLAGRRGVSPLGGYSSTKFALVGMTEALRVELFNTGIKVSLVMPGSDRHAHGARCAQGRFAQGRVRHDGDAGAMGDVGGAGCGRVRADGSGRSSRRRGRGETRVVVPGRHRRVAERRHQDHAGRGSAYGRLGQAGAQDEVVSM